MMEEPCKYGELYKETIFGERRVQRPGRGWRTRWLLNGLEVIASLRHSSNEAPSEMRRNMIEYICYRCKLCRGQGLNREEQSGVGQIGSERRGRLVATRKNRKSLKRGIKLRKMSQKR
jgi:hypothetical protein